MEGIFEFDVYGMALILLHQSGAKVVEDYAFFAKSLKINYSRLCIFEI